MSYKLYLNIFFPHGDFESNAMDSNCANKAKPLKLKAAWNPRRVYKLHSSRRESEGTRFEKKRKAGADEVNRMT